MKLSISVLSSILAVCSVTIANPIDPSSTMSAAASTPTASSSATPADGSTFITTSGSYAQHLVDCYPIGEEGIIVIKQYADVKQALKNIEESLNKKKSERDAQREVFENIKKKINDLETKANGSNNSEDYELEVAGLDADFEKHRKTHKKLRGECWEINNERADLKQKLAELQMKLIAYFLGGNGFMTPTNNDFSRLGSVPGFMNCFGKFYNGPLQ
ncbi:hypothetical protein MT418_007491 [Batrachochytrium dendrobatidis]